MIPTRFPVGQILADAGQTDIPSPALPPGGLSALHRERQPAAACGVWWGQGDLAFEQINVDACRGTQQVCP